MLEADVEIDRREFTIAVTLAVAPGERLALQLRNSPEWVVVEQAALGLGLVVVPLYLDDRPDSVAYILRDCGARILVLADDRYRRLASALAGGALQRGHEAAPMCLQSAGQAGSATIRPPHRARGFSSCRYPASDPPATAVQGPEPSCRSCEAMRRTLAGR